MSDLGIFIWGILAFIMAIGPLTIAAYLDYRDRAQK